METAGENARREGASAGYHLRLDVPANIENIGSTQLRHFLEYFAGATENRIMNWLMNPRLFTETLSKAALTRRGLLRGAAAIGTALVFGKVARSAPEDLIVDQPPLEYTLEERLEPILAGRQPREDRVTLEMPAYAEDGSVVPLRIKVDGPLLGSGYVKSLYLFVDNNPDPLIFTSKLAPTLGSVDWKMKIRMRETSMVRAIAEMDNGDLFLDTTEVEVSISGCG